MSLAPEVAPEIHIPLRARGLQVVDTSAAPPTARPIRAVTRARSVQAVSTASPLSHEQRPRAVRPIVEVASSTLSPPRPALLVRPRPGSGERSVPDVVAQSPAAPVAFLLSPRRSTAVPRPKVADEPRRRGEDAAIDLDAAVREPSLEPLWVPADGLATVDVRITRRGQVVLVLAAVVVALAVVIGAWISGRGTSSESGAHGSGVGTTVGTDQIVVHDGDTLWSIAAFVAPGRDPRAEVADLVRLNRLNDAALRPGQVLRLR